MTGEKIRTQDDGCPEATACLGQQSYCLVNCPFKKCVMDEPLKRQIKRQRDREIRARAKRGESRKALVERYGLSPRMVRKILAGTGTIDKIIGSGGIVI